MLRTAISGFNYTIDVGFVKVYKLGGNVKWTKNYEIKGGEGDYFGGISLSNDGSIMAISGASDTTTYNYVRVFNYL